MKKIYWKGVNHEMSGVVERTIVTYEVRLDSGMYVTVDERNVLRSEEVKDDE